MNEAGELDELQSASLAEAAGVSYGCVRDIVRERYPTTSFTIADSLLVKTGALHLWFMEPLREFYVSVPCCRNGHQLSDENLYRGRCRACRREQVVARKTREKVAA